jgi:hypothetical protein
VVRARGQDGRRGNKNNFSKQDLKEEDRERVIRKRSKGKSLREMRKLAVHRGRWKEFIQTPLTL